MTREILTCDKCFIVFRADIREITWDCPRCGKAGGVRAAIKPKELKIEVVKKLEELL